MFPRIFRIISTGNKLFLQTCISLQASCSIALVDKESHTARMGQRNLMEWPGTLSMCGARCPPASRGAACARMVAMSSVQSAVVSVWLEAIAVTFGMGIVYSSGHLATQTGDVQTCWEYPFTVLWSSSCPATQTPSWIICKVGIAHVLATYHCSWGSFSIAYPPFLIMWYGDFN